jgi:spore coat polysaccharide biosynthesis predicted glycosyltransferase SpsG
MKTASTMIGAGGSMHWERAASGVAGMIITLADNQIETTRTLHKQQCCLWIGKSDDVTQKDISEAINFAISSPEKMRKLADNAASLLNSNKNPSFVVDTILNSIKR